MEIMKAWIIWTTFVCNGGEIPTKPITNMYSSEVFFSMEDVQKAKNSWQRYLGVWYGLSFGKNCAPFMIQHEEVSDKRYLKKWLKIY